MARRPSASSAQPHSVARALQQNTVTSANSAAVSAPEAGRGFRRMAPASPLCLRMYSATGSAMKGR